MGFFSKSPPKPDADTEVMLAMLLSPDEEDRVQAARVVSVHAPEHALHPLVEAFENESSARVRAAIVFSIGRLPDSKKARALLHRAHDDHDPNVFCTAAVVLGQRGDGKGIRTLYTILMDSEPGTPTYDIARKALEQVDTEDARGLLKLHDYSRSRGIR
jgi:HEAT repeat protein